MISKKQFGGVIEHWHKQQVAGAEYGGMIISKRSLDTKFGKSLGYIIRGFLEEDPTGRFGRGPLRTSLVVKINKAQTEIETLNTIYHLGEPFSRVPRVGEFF
jgi:hypothetical protein